MIIADEPRNLDDHTPLEGLTDRELINLVESKGDATPLEEKLVQRMKLLYARWEQADEEVGAFLDEAFDGLKAAKDALLGLQLIK